MQAKVRVDECREQHAAEVRERASSGKAERNRPCPPAKSSRFWASGLQKAIRQSQFSNELTDERRSNVRWHHCTVLYVPISCDADARRASEHVVGGGTNLGV
jgi:hypothetical protein